jgi:hypothetical protein
MGPCGKLPRGDDGDWRRKKQEKTRRNDPVEQRSRDKLKFDAAEPTVT